MKSVWKKALGCLSAAGLYLALTAIPAMAQEEILINPNAIQKLQNVSADTYGHRRLDITAGELFVGIQAQGSILTTVSDSLQKYNPNEWELVGKDGCYFNFFDNAGNNLFMYLEADYIDDFYMTFPEPDISMMSHEQWRIAVERPLASHQALYPTSFVSLESTGNLDAIIAGITLINSAFPNAVAAAPAQPAIPAQTAAAVNSGWKLADAGWWYDNGDGTWPAGGWKWIDANADGVSECYYFDANGYIITNGKTPDNYEVNADGAWVVNGVIQTQ